jgi:ribosome modulation factor
MAATNDLICEASRVYRTDRRSMDSQNGKLRAHLKNFGEQGVDLKALQRVSKAFGRIEPEEFVKILATELHYAKLILRAEAQPEMFFGDDMDTTVSNMTRYSDDVMTAESKGYDAGRQGMARDECPYQEPELAKAWTKWWKNGSEQRTEAKPASKPANASRKEARKRQTRMAGTEGIQHSPKRKRRQKAAAPQAQEGKRRGRPKGSKNRPKVNGPEVVDFPAAQLPPAA